MQDIVNDDMVLLHLQYSTQWDTLAHVGAMFDADGDGKPEPVFYNGYRAGEDIVGEARLIDAYQIVVNPVVLGRGRTLFETVNARLPLELSRTKAFGNGNVVLWYEPS